MPLPLIGEPVPLVAELLEVIESALALQPKHPGLCHLYIHTLEMSPTPARALPYIDAAGLRTASPDNPHLCHMPTHIDVLVGDYDAAIKGNALAITADRKVPQQKMVMVGQNRGPSLGF